MKSMLPNQKIKQRTDDLEEELNTPTSIDVEDEFTKINKLSFKLFKILATQIETLENIYRPSRDYKKFIQQLEEDDEDTFCKVERQVEIEDQGNETENEEDNEDNGDSNSSTSTLTPTSMNPTSTSNSYTSDESFPSTPNNSPTTRRYQEYQGSYQAI